MRFRIGTRKSKLALAQTELVREAVLERFPEAQVEIVPMGSPGDRAKEQALTSFGGKGVFTQDLERALLAGEIDLAVHSAKDLPVELPERLSFRAVLAREDPADVLVTANGIPAAGLPAGSVIGSGSLRRGLQLRKLNPQVRMKLLRGNVPTRLQKLKDGRYDGIVLAWAGLSRLGLLAPEGLHVEVLDKKNFLPAPGQGILCVEFRTGEFTGLLDELSDPEVDAALAAEREFLRVIGGGCNAPCAAWCRREEDELLMDVMYAADGKHPAYAGGSVKLSVLSAGQSGGTEETSDGEDGLWPVAPAGVESASVEEGKSDSWKDGESGSEEDCDRKKPVSAGRLGTQEIKSMAVKLARQLAGQVRLRPVALVGAGPGNAGLITERGLACIRKAGVLVYDDLIPVSLVNEAPLAAKLVYVGKRLGHHAMRQEEICALLVREAQTGAYVVRLKGGDPFVFGRGGEEALALRERGIPFEVVPGVTSACAAPAFAGIPVTERGLASSFHVITGHESAGKSGSALDYTALAKEEGTLVFLMGLSRLSEIAAELIRFGKDPETPAAVIECGGMAGQKKARAALKNIAQEAKAQGLQTPAVIVVGGTAALGDRLEWFGGGPLSGVRVLVTGTRHFCARLAAELAPLGAQTEAVSLIESVRTGGGAGKAGETGGTVGKRPSGADGEVRSRVSEEGIPETLTAPQDEAKRAVRELSRCRWLVFTSANGVELFFALLAEERIDLRALSHLKFAVIGSGTAAALEAHGFLADFVPSDFSGAGLAAEWLPTLKKDDRVFLMRAREGSPVLPERLTEAGISFTDVPLYENWVDTRRGGDLHRLVKEADYLVFASASAVRAAAELLTGEAAAAPAGDRRPDCPEAGKPVAGTGAAAEASDAADILPVTDAPAEADIFGSEDCVSEIRARVIAIGPYTARAAKTAGFTVQAVAAEYTAEGLAAAILADRFDLQKRG